MAKRSNLELAKRMEAVLSLVRKEEPAGRIARRYGVSEPTLYRWPDEFLEGGQHALSGSKNGDSAERQRIRELEREGTQRLRSGLMITGRGLRSDRSLCGTSSIERSWDPVAGSKRT